MLIISPDIKTLLIFGAMKVTAFFMIVCLSFLTAFPVKAKAMHTSAIKTCCRGMEKQAPCNPVQKDDCSGGMGNITLTCPSCSFLTVDRTVVKPLIPIFKEIQTTPYHMGDLSGYSLINWNPPKV